MKKTKISVFFGLIAAILLSLTLVNAAQSFSMTPTTISDTVNINQADSTAVTITNTGDEEINLTIATTATNFNLISNVSTITKLEAGNSIDILLTYTAQTTTGTQTGSAYIENSDDSSINDTIPVSLTINNPAPTGASIDIVDVGNTIQMFTDSGKDEDKTFRFKNDGTVDLTNVRFTITDLDSRTDNIDNSDIKFDPDNGFDLNIDDTEYVNIDIDMPKVDVGLYEGVVTITTDEGYTVDFDFELNVGGDFEVEFDYGGLDLDSDGVLLIYAEEGERETAEFTVDNVGDIDASNLRFEIDGDLEEQFSDEILPLSAISFDPVEIDIKDNEEEDIEIEIQVPDGQPSGNYIGDIDLVDSSGDVLDSITLKVKVIGDVYIQTPIDIEEDIVPGTTLDVPIRVFNEGSKIIRGMKITATLYDVDFGRSDITESTSTFSLDVNDDKTETLRFNIPDDASDGTHDLEIRLTYDDQELVELEQININRPINNIVIDSYSINPRVAKCDNSVFTYLKFKNLGKYDRDIKVSAEIVGTNIKQSSNTYELSVDEIDQQNFVLDITSLEAGTYTVSQKISYNSRFEKETSTLTVLECAQGAPGIDIKPINDTQINQTQNQTDIVKVFGKDMEKSTVYLGSGLVLVVILIVVSLFLI